MAYIEDVVGLEISSVCFVRDYIEICFDGPVIRLIGTVFVREDGIYFRDGDQGFEARARNLIGRKITGFRQVMESAFLFEIEADGSVEVRRNDGEMMHFISEYNGPIAIW